MIKPNPKGSRLATMISRFLWVIVLVPILGISAYSLFYVARYLGAPPWLAIATSTCFDGTALLCADYSLRYAQVGLGGAGPRFLVRAIALVAAYLQTLHAKIGHEPPGSWVLWASLPIVAVVVYEVHIRWERRVALARMGVTYPAPLPAFGVVSWVLFPLMTAKSLREITERRTDAIKAAALGRSPIPEIDKEPLQATAEPVTEPSPSNRPVSGKPTLTIASSNGPNANRPNPKAVRAWAKLNGWPDISDRARIPQAAWEAYIAATDEEAV